MHKGRGENKKNCGSSMLELHCMIIRKKQRSMRKKQLHYSPGTQNRHLLEPETSLGMCPSVCPAAEDLGKGLGIKNATKGPSTQPVWFCTERTCLRIKKGRKRGRKEWREGGKEGGRSK